jgi:hypothetical protein
MLSTYVCAGSVLRELIARCTRGKLLDEVLDFRFAEPQAACAKPNAGNSPLRNEMVDGARRQAQQFCHFTHVEKTVAHRIPLSLQTELYQGCFFFLSFLSSTRGSG